MKIIISPSKTKDIKGTPSAPKFAPHMTEQIIQHMQSLPKETIGKALKLKDTVLDEVYDFYQHYDKEVLKEEKTNLYAWWQPLVDAAVGEEDWILNLASKEYSKWINHPKMVTIEFLEHRNGVWKQLSTSSKQMRGSLAHYICEHQVTELSQLPKELKGFVLDPLPTDIDGSIIIAYRKE